MGVRLGDWAGNDKPFISYNKISFNGYGEESCETFVVSRIFESDREPSNYPETKGKYFAFCKTRQFPYDLNVQCCLIVFKHYLRDAFYVSSDGDPEEWKDAQGACQKILGYGKNFKCDGWDEE